MTSSLRLTLAPLAFLALTTAMADQAEPQGTHAGASGGTRVEQTMRRTAPTLNESISAAAQAFRAPYAKAKQPRILVLMNRDIEDNDKDTMVKTGKVAGGISVRGNGKEKVIEGGASTYAPVAPDPSAFGKFDLATLQDAFEGVLAGAGVRLSDRDTAVRMHGITEEAVFSYEGLPEAQRAQVEGVRKYADVLVSVKIRPGSATVRKVSGDVVVSAPIMLVKAIRLSDAQVLATVSSSAVAPGSTETESVQGVAVELLYRLADSLGNR